MTGTTTGGQETRTRGQQTHTHYSYLWHPPAWIAPLSGAVPIKGFLSSIFSLTKLTHQGPWSAFWIIFGYGFFTPQCHWHHGAMPWTQQFSLRSSTFQTWFFFCSIIGTVLAHMFPLSLFSSWSLLKLPEVMIKKQLWLCSVKYIKIAEKYLQNLEPLHKNVLDNEPRVQMSFNHEKTVLKVLSNCLFKAGKKPLKPKAKQAQMGYYREKRGSKFSQSCPFK